MQFVFFSFNRRVSRAAELCPFDASGQRRTMSLQDVLAVATIVSGLAGAFAIIGTLAALIRLEVVRCTIPGAYDHLDDGETYPGKKLILERGGTLRGKDPGTSGWKSNFWLTELEIWWGGDCRIRVARKTSGVYEGYYTQGRDRTKKVRLQKRLE